MFTLQRIKSYNIEFKPEDIGKYDDCINEMDIIDICSGSIL